MGHGLRAMVASEHSPGAEPTGNHTAMETAAAWPWLSDLANTRPAVATPALIPVARQPLRLALGLLLLALPSWMTINLARSATAPTSSTPTGPASLSPGAAPSWLNRPGHSFWDSRPWVYGWYRVHPDVWSWWGASSNRWGLASLAPAATITGLVQASLSSGSTVIVVPGGTERLDIGSLQAVRPMGVRFQYAGEGLAWSPGSADCQAGLLAGLTPQTPLEAQRLNAACQLTYGNP